MTSPAEPPEPHNRLIDRVADMETFAKAVDGATSKQPEDLRAEALSLINWHVVMGSEADQKKLADDIHRLYKAAALAARPEKKQVVHMVDGKVWSEPSRKNEFDGFNDGVTTYQANIHSVFGGKSA